jgi:hypothetical protein
MDCIMARHGHEEAERRVIDFLGDMPDWLCGWHGSTGTDYISYASTEKMQRVLAEGIRSTEIVGGTGGRAKREICMEVLLKMMQASSDFPFRYYIDVHDPAKAGELDRLEAWCEEHLGVTYPGEPRPTVPFPGFVE